jgi:hypothetical protein
MEASLLSDLERVQSEKIDRASLEILEIDLITNEGSYTVQVPRGAPVQQVVRQQLVEKAILVGHEKLLIEFGKRLACLTSL